jgi:hypothetical protein
MKEHGNTGKRNAAKPKGAAKLPLYLRLSPAIMERLKQLPRGKKNAFIECAMVKALDELEAMK